MSTPRRLDPEAIVATATTLEHRVGDRFPGRGISRLAAELVSIAGETEGRLQALNRPRWMIRALVALIVVVATSLLALTVTAVEFGARVDRFDELLMLLENGMQDVVFLGLGVAFLVSLEGRLKRRDALRGLHELRSIAHVIDMHQLTKDPEFLLSPGRQTPHSPRRIENRFELGRYLDYCSEMLSLTAKLAALYAQNSQDSVVLDSVRDVQQIAGQLSGKIWQKIVILDSIAVGEPERQ